MCLDETPFFPVDTGANRHVPDGPIFSAYPGLKLMQLFVPFEPLQEFQDDSFSPSCNSTGTPSRSACRCSRSTLVRTDAAQCSHGVHSRISSTVFPLSRA